VPKIFGDWQEFYIWFKDWQVKIYIFEFSSVGPVMETDSKINDIIVEFVFVNDAVM